MNFFKSKPLIGYFSKLSVIILLLLVSVISCKKSSIESLQVDENVLMQVGFDSKTTTFSELAAHVDQSQLDTDQKHVAMTLAVPVVQKNRHLFRIFKDGTYELVIDILEPVENPAREAFREEYSRNDWELAKIIMDNISFTAYDKAGNIILSEDNSDNVYFNKLVEKIMTDDYFAKNVNIGNALFKVSAGAENLLDPKLREFFVSPEAEIFFEEGYLMIKENLVASMKHWGVNGQFSSNGSLKSGPTGPNYFDTTATNDSYTLAETEQMITDQADDWTNQKSVSDLNVITMIDSTNSEVSAEVIYAGDEQVVSNTTFEVNNDPQQTIKTQLIEGFETNPSYDLDFVNTESVEYSNVQIINNN